MKITTIIFFRIFLSLLLLLFTINLFSQELHFWVKNQKLNDLTFLFVRGKYCPDYFADVQNAGQQSLGIRNVTFNLQDKNGISLSLKGDFFYTYYSDRASDAPILIISLNTDDGIVKTVNHLNFFYQIYDENYWYIDTNEGRYWIERKINDKNKSTDFFIRLE